MCMCSHQHMHAHSKPKKKQNTKKREKKQEFGCLWVCFTPTLFLFCDPPPLWQETGRLEQSVMWHFRPLFCTTPANMQAHLSRALKPSLILWRPKHFNFFQQTSSQLALDCQWGSPNSKIYHLETHKSPLRQIFSFKASQKKKRPQKLGVELSNSMSPLPHLFLVSL